MLRFLDYKLVLAVLAILVFLDSGLVQAKQPVDTSTESGIRVAELPVQGFLTYELIHQGGQFAHEKDGVVFGNRELLLPNHKRGYYREYTVKTPDSRDRGARRIVCGGQLRVPDVCFYTADHYASFRKIVP
jgi:ribonuclease T1